MLTNNALFAILGPVKEWLSLSCHYSCNLICHACRAHKDSFAAPSDLKNQHRHDLASFLAESVKLDELRRTSVQIGSLFLSVVLLHLGFVKKGMSLGLVLDLCYVQIRCWDPNPPNKKQALFWTYRISYHKWFVGMLCTSSTWVWIYGWQDQLFASCCNMIFGEVWIWLRQTGCW